MERAGNVRRPIGSWIANIDEHALPFVELLLGLMYLNLWNPLHSQTLRAQRMIFKASTKND
jgi:hypothetical protein